VEAVNWYGKTADQGNVVGQSNLGVMYENGKGVEKNLGRALYWLAKAAVQGDTFAKEESKSLTAKGVVPLAQ